MAASSHDPGLQNSQVDGSQKPAPRVGVVFRPQLPPERLREFVTSAEAAGLDDLWLWEDCFLEGGLTSVTAALAGTSSLLSARAAVGTAAQVADVIRSFAAVGATSVALQPTAHDPDPFAVIRLAAGPGPSSTPRPGLLSAHD